MGTVVLLGLRVHRRVRADLAGATGWARSISRERNLRLDLDARSHRLAVLVREAFPAPGFGTDLTTAMVDDGVVAVTSEVSDGGVIFGE